MKFWIIGIIVWVVGLASIAALAEPYEPKRIPADAQWVAHVDLRKAVNSQLGQLLLKDFAPLGLEEKLAAVKILVGLDPLHDFEDATLYGKTFDEQSAVLVLRMRGDTSKLRALAELNENYALTTYKDLRIHSWTEAGHYGKHTPRYVGVYETPGEGITTTISAMDLEAVEKQLDLLVGKGASLANGTGKLATPDEAGVFVFASVTGLSDLGELAKGMHSEILRAAESLMVVVAERDGQMSASVKLTAGTEEQATAIQQMAMGAVAIARLAMPQDIDPNIRNLVNRLTVTQVNRAVTANISYASAELHGIIKKSYEKELQRIQQAGPTGPSSAPQQKPAEAAAPSESTEPAQP